MREDSEEVIISRIWDNHGKEVGYEQKGVLVRCKDCKYHEDFLFDDGDKVLCWVHDVDIVMAKNDYCSYGERKDDE